MMHDIYPKNKTLEMPSDLKSKILPEAKCGDIIRVSRGLYFHYGIYVGDDHVIHVAPIKDESDKDKDGFCHVSASLVSGCRIATDKAIVRKEHIQVVQGKGTAEVYNELDEKFDPLSPDEIVQNAEEMINEIGYNLLFRNCEHFANQCRYGLPRSEQVKNLKNKVIGTSLMAAVLCCTFGSIAIFIMAQIHGVGSLEAIIAHVITVVTMLIFTGIVMGPLSFKCLALGKTKNVRTKIGEICTFYWSGWFSVSLTLVAISLCLVVYYQMMEKYSILIKSTPCNSSHTSS